MTTNINLKNDREDNIYDLFISHYQYNGGHLALNLKLLIEKENEDIKIFLDVDSDMKNIHNLENFIRESKNVLLIITENVFERYFVQLELREALKYNKNIILLWDRNNCPIFPKKEQIPNDLVSILDIKAIIWQSERKYRKLVIEDIIENIKIDEKNKYDNNLSPWLSDMYSCSTNDSITGIPSYSEDYMPQLSSTNYSSIYSNKELNSHEQFHSLDRSFQCDNCKRKFARKHDLIRHIRVHTDIKPYSCLCCKKSFARTDSLKRHLRMEDVCRFSPENSTLML